MQIFYQKCEPADTFPLEEFIDINMLSTLFEDDSLSVESGDLILRHDANGLSLYQASDLKTAPTRVDFENNALAHRVATSRAKQGLLKAIGLDKAATPLKIIDATAGMGVEAWLMAAMGCQVTMLERSPVMAALLADGLRRVRNNGSAMHQEIAARLSLEQGDAMEALELLVEQNGQPDVIYLDPMFPPRQKSAKVKKDMALMQMLLPANDDVDEMLALSLELAGKRVVLKRPGKAQKLSGSKPEFQVPGKACHFQVFLTA